MAGPGKPGRKRIEIDYELVEELAAEGLNERQIAASMGIGYDTITRRKKENQDFQSAYKNGKATLIQKLTNHGVDMALKRDPKHSTYWVFCMKNLAGWTDRQTVEGNPDKPITVQDAFVGALKNRKKKK